MKTRIIFIGYFVFVLLISSLKTYSCTTFCLADNNQVVYGRNFDFEISSGFIVNNRKNLMKYALLSTEENILQWTSRYGSITFNQVGMEFPYGGMNEKGLVIAQMYLSRTRYPNMDNRKAISCLQWIQYQLDVSATVNDVLKSDSTIRISNEIPVGIHFLVSDKSGKSVTIEFINGKMVYRFDNNLPIPLLSNNTYDESFDYLKQFDGFGGKETIKWTNINDFEWTDNNTLNTNKLFATAAKNMIKKNDSITLIDKAFGVLESVTIKNHTQWSIVFDITNMKIYFKNNQHCEIVSLDFRNFIFNSNADVKMLDIQSAKADKINEQFMLYSTDRNREYTLKATIPLIESGFIPEIPLEAIEIQVQYPETFQVVTQ
ncbi:MAG: linear amide C-N hydrolase [Bacteroidetes bacterium]|nr:linear amide C-N hydrolase [Bacteroidota bacterium]